MRNKSAIKVIILTIQTKIFINLKFLIKNNLKRK